MLESAVSTETSCLRDNKPVWSNLRLTESISICQINSYQSCPIIIFSESCFLQSMPKYKPNVFSHNLSAQNRRGRSHLARITSILYILTDIPLSINFSAMNSVRSCHWISLYVLWITANIIIHVALYVLGLI